jgi:hypothetical protein
LPACFLGGHCGKLGKTVHAPSVFAFQVALGVESLDLGSEAGVEPFSVESGNEIDAGLAFSQASPCRLGVEAQRTYYADASDKNSTIVAHILSQLCAPFTCGSNGKANGPHKSRLYQ